MPSQPRRSPAPRKMLEEIQEGQETEASASRGERPPSRPADRAGGDASHPSDHGDGAPSPIQEPLWQRWMGTARREPASWIFLGMVALLVAWFAVAFTDASLTRYQTFNSSINDLGYWNQVFWATAHGGPGVWNATSRSNFYASYPYQFLALLVLLPFYLLQPDPTTLLVLQGLLLPLAAIPLYFLARSHDLSWPTSAAVASLFLANYQIQGAVLNDFHIQAMFPFFFFAAALAERKGQPLAFLALGIVAALTNPLDLLVVLTFTGRWLGLDLLRRGAPRARLSRLWRTFLGDRLRAMMLILLVGLVVVELALGSIGDYHLVAGTGVPAPSYSTTLADRATYLVMTALPFLALSLFSLEFLLVASPMFVFLLVAPVSYFQFFGHQDAIEYVAVFLWGLVLFLDKSRRWRLLERLGTLRLPGAAAHAVPPVPTRTSRPVRLLRDPLLPAGVSLLVTLVLMISYSPLSPWNGHPDLLASVNEDPSLFERVTAADRFLDLVLPLIPGGASVLTQNNIPQLTGRPDFNWAFPGKDAGNVTRYQYVLADFDIENPFAEGWYYQLRPYEVQAFQSHQFGLVAFGSGVTLLERGYVGGPVLKGPTDYPASDLALRSGNLSAGIATHTGGMSPIFWYGPYTPLVPGNYTVAFNLSVSSVTPASSPIIILGVAVDNGTSQDHLVYVNVTLGQFPAPQAWTRLNVSFSLPYFASEVEFPGYWATSAATLSIADIELTLRSP